MVDEKKNILIASAAPHPDLNAIREALAGIQSYKISVFTEDNFPASLSEYDVIILHGLPSIRSNIAERLLAAKKPVWFILSNQSGIAAINSMSSLTNTNLAQSQPHDVLPTFNPAFNTFTLPPQIQAVTDKMPPLIVNVSNILAPPGTNAIFTQKTGVGDMRSPLWLLQQGSVPFAYLAGEGLWRWRLYEFKNFGNHNVIDECIRQTVAFLGTANSDKPFSVSLPKAVWSDQEAVFLKAYLRNANNEPINTPEVSITITDSAGNKRPFSFERLGNAYSLNIGIWAGGAYTYTAQTTYNSKNYTTSGSFAVQSVPLEFMEQGADYNLLYSLARQNNGGFVTAPAIGSLYDSITTNQNIKPLIQTNTETVPFVDKKWYFFIILALAAAEWLLRKYWLAQ